MAMKLAAVGLIGENATEEAGRSEVYPKDSIDQHQRNCEPVIKNEPIKYPSLLEQVQTTINVAIEE